MERTKFLAFFTGMGCTFVYTRIFQVSGFEVHSTEDLDSNVQENESEKFASRDIFCISPETNEKSHLKQLFNLHLNKQHSFPIPHLLIRSHLQKLHFEDKDVITAMDRISSRNQTIDVSKVINEVMTIRRENNLPHICAPGVDVDIISHKTTITTPDFKNPESNYDITTHFNPNIQINPHRTQEASFKGTHTAYWITGLSTIFGPDIVRKIISKIATVGPNSILLATGIRGSIWSTAVSFTIAFPFLYINHVRTMKEVIIPYTFIPMYNVQDIVTSSVNPIPSMEYTNNPLEDAAISYCTMLPIVCGISALIGAMVL